MCYLIYLSLLALSLYFSDYLLSQYSLSVTNGAGELMSVAQGWEIASILWPVFLLSAVIGSAATFFANRQFDKRK